MIFISFSSFSQSLTNKSIEELEKMKKEAISSENFELANKISEEQKSRVSLDDKIKELNNNLKIAVANENFEEAEKLKNEIKKVEEKKAKLNQLEEEKKAAILIEDFDKVIALDKQISDLKNDRKPSPPAINNSPTTQQTTQTVPVSENAPLDFGGGSGGLLGAAVNRAHLVGSQNATSNSTSIIFPTELTPNGDGINDLLVFQNLENYPENFLLITNGWVTIYRTTNYKNDWNGGSAKAGKYTYSLTIKGGKFVKGGNSKLGTFILYK